MKTGLTFLAGSMVGALALFYELVQFGMIIGW